MKHITKAAWDRLHQCLCDLANAAEADDDVLYEVYLNRLFECLDEIERKFGVHSETLDLRADFLEDAEERWALYRQALALAKEAGDSEQIGVVRQSLEELEAERREQDGFH